MTATMVFRNALATVAFGVGMAVMPGTSAAEPPSSADRAAVEACLAQVKTNQSARLPDAPAGGGDTGTAGRLKAAQDDAARDPQSCVGIISTACLARDGNDSTAAMAGCYAREHAVWDARLNAAYQKALAEAKSSGDAEVEENYRKVQRAWIVYRDATCETPACVFKGTMAVPMQASCMASMTAQQAIWLETWSENGAGN